MNPKEGNLSLPVNLICTFAIVLVIMLHASTIPISVAKRASVLWSAAPCFVAMIKDYLKMKWKS